LFLMNELQKQSEQQQLPFLTANILLQKVFLLKAEGKPFFSSYEELKKVLETHQEVKELFDQLFSNHEGLNVFLEKNLHSL